MIMQVHDELVFEVEAHAAHDMLEQIQMMMKNHAELSIPLIVNAKVANNWGEAH